MATVGNVYWRYVRFFGPAIFSLAMFIFVVAQLIRIFSDVWISRWATRQYKTRSEEWYIWVYFAYVCCFFVGVVVRSLFFLSRGLDASDRIHGAVLATMLRAPMAYFNATPVGSLLAFFSKDLDMLDDIMVDNMCMCVTYVCILGTTLGVVIGTLPIFAAIVAGLLLGFFLVFFRYSRACTVLKLKFNRATSDVVAQTSETLFGLSVVRAFAAEQRFLEGNLELQDRAGTSGLALGTLSLWMSFRLDLIGCLLVVATCLLAVANDGLTAAASGLAVSNSFQILLFFSIMTSTMGEIHANVGSVNRASQLLSVSAEPDVHDQTQGQGPVGPPVLVPEGWPTRGEVRFESVVMSYLPDKPPVLRGVNFFLQAGEKIGVVGRTGAGKSSLIIALYRMAELSEGCMRVDGVDLGTSSISDYRRRFAIIPQEPIMFSGTLRSNLDPAGTRTDTELLAALEDCLLGPMVRSLSKGLQAPVEHLGANFSLGQQQLVCLARARLSASRLLLLDEATAALDSDTDAAVQSVLRRIFSDRTVVTIAHRLDTVIDSDRILAMDTGRVVELAPPEQLLDDESSVFYSLCRNTGPAQFEALRAAARTRPGSRWCASASRSGIPPAPVEPTLSIGEVNADGF